MKRKKIIMMILLTVCLMVSLLSFPMMALAADRVIYDPADYETGSPVVDEFGVITYYYDFGVSPLFKSYYEDVFSAEFTSDPVTLYPPVGTKKITLRTFPLGVYASSNSPWPAGGGVVDVRDFKAYSQFELSAEFDISWSFIYPPSGTLEMRSFWNVFCYDESGWFTGTISSGTTVKTWDISNNGTTGGTYYAGGVIQLPENTAYILPLCVNSLYTPGITESTYFSIRATDLSISFSIDSVLENTLTMQVIKDQLAKQYESMEEMNEILGDTFDGLFGDDYAGKEDIEQNKSDSETTVEDIEDAVDSLYAMEADLKGLTHDSLSDFLKTRSWKLARDLVSPIMEWNHTGVIMLLVVSLVNLSIILIGR